MVYWLSLVCDFITLWRNIYINKLVSTQLFTIAPEKISVTAGSFFHLTESGL